MTYPAAPWTLFGCATASLHFLDIRRSRIFIPAELEIVPIIGQKTLGGLYFATYQSGSSLCYHELMAIAGLVRYQSRLGTWVSHIYVDNPDSVAGGREIWQLPKELAEFAWHDQGVTVRQAGRELCRLRYASAWYHPRTWWQQTIAGESFSGLSEDLLVFSYQAAAKFALASANLHISSQSPLAKLHCGQPCLALHCPSLQLQVEAPISVGKRTLPVYS